MQDKRAVPKRHKILHIIRVILTAVILFFVVTFGIYFFNLDMKLSSGMDPILDQIYDRVKREPYE